MKLLTFSFDDNEIYDRRVCELLRRYGLKATFYLISGQLGIRVPFHRYGRDTVVERVNASELAETYRGMEIGSHTRNHSLNVSDPVAEMNASLAELSVLSGQPVCGLAYPGGAYTPELVAGLPGTAVAYARGATPTHDFSFPENRYAWQPTCHWAERETPALVERFLSAPPECDLLLHLFGHSYEMTNPDGSGDWAHFEGLLRHLSARPDVMYVTNGEAMREILRKREGPADRSGR